MSVAIETTLPAQPATGTCRYVPLGGDGFTSPASSYHFWQAIAGDASGGYATLTAHMDPRFAALVSFLTVQVNSAAAVPDVKAAIHAAPSTEQDVVLNLIGGVPLFTTTGQAMLTWSPSPLFNAESIVVDFDNVDATELYVFTAVIYNFNIRAAEQTPLSVLLASLPRASSAI